jgi:hypothetical protein
MRRTQVYLTEEQWQRLAYIGRREGLTVSELIRKAIDEVYSHPDAIDFDDLLDKITGIWSDRSDMGRTEDYIRELRKDQRLERFARSR